MKKMAYKISCGVSITIALLTDTHNVDRAHIFLSLHAHHLSIIAFAEDLLGYRSINDEPIMSERGA